MDKEIGLQPNNGILHLTEKGCTIVIQCNINESQNNYAEWEKPDQTKDMLYDSLYGMTENSN